MNSVFLHALVAWRLGIRSHAMRALISLGALLLGVAYLAGAFSLRQPLVVALDMGLSGLRFLGLLLILFWMQEAFAKDVDRRTITFALAYPAERGAYVLGRFLGVSALVLMAIALWGSLLFLVNFFADWGYEQSSRNTFSFGYLLVLFGIFLDLLVIGAFFVLLVSIAETPALPFIISFGFAVVSRSIGVVADYLALSRNVDQDLKQMLLPTLERLLWLIPDLSRLDWRTIVLYDHWPPFNDLLQGISIAVGYLLILLVCSVSIYRKRNFS